METQNLEFENRLDLSGLEKAAREIKAELRKIIVGQEAMIDLLLTAILANGHVLLEGVPGVAKTLTARLLARTLSVEFSRIQFTPDLMPSDVLGTSIFNPKSLDFEFKAGPIFANLVLIDEINRAPAKTQSALFEVMEERQVTLDGTRHVLKPPFLVVATQNPLEHEGTYRLPEAQLDRFLFKISVGYPSLEEETTLLNDFHARKSVNDPALLKAVLKAKELIAYQQTVREIHIEAPLVDYIAQLVQKTRTSRDIYVGGSPRASLAILMGAKAFAALQGRDFVTPEDIQTVAYPVLRHRLILTPEKEMEGTTPDVLIADLLERLDVPR